MAHPSQMQFIKSVSENLAGSYTNLRVLEIGSYDVNGSVRRYFSGSDYVGVDLIEGPGVDIVCEGDKFDRPDEFFDIAISCECFEHNPNWAETFLNMVRMIKNGGVLIITCATTGRPEHGTTRTEPTASPGTQSLNWDYYKNLTELDFQDRIEISKYFKNYFFINFETDLYFFGIKKSNNIIFPVDFVKLKALCEADQIKLQSLIANRKKIEKFIPKIIRPLTRKIFNM